MTPPPRLGRRSQSDANLATSIWQSGKNSNLANLETCRRTWMQRQNQSGGRPNLAACLQKTNGATSLLDYVRSSET